MSRELDRVSLCQPVPEHCLPRGATGSVVGVYADGVSIEVELTEVGRTVTFRHLEDNVQALGVSYLARGLR